MPCQGTWYSDPFLNVKGKSKMIRSMFRHSFAGPGLLLFVCFLLFMSMRRSRHVLHEFAFPCLFFCRLFVSLASLV